MPASFENMQGSNDIAVDVCVRVLERVAHTGLSTEVYDAIE